MIDDRTLQIVSNPRSPVAEAFRVARTNIEFSGVDKDMRTILVTSSMKGEGKTTVSANLAAAFAQLGRRVLIVDADFRRPMVHKVFGLDNRQGITTSLLKHGSPLEYVRPTAVPGLFALPSGPIPPNPSELLMTSAMAAFLESVKPQFDHIVFDTPPVTIVTDAAILTTKVDGTVLVVRSGTVDRRLLKRAMALLDQVKANILGVVVNGINRVNEAYYYQYYYYNYYGPSSKEPSRRKRRVRRMKGASSEEAAPQVREVSGLGTHGTVAPDAPDPSAGRAPQR